MKNKLRSLQRGDKIAVILILFIAVITHFGWLFSNSIFTSGDWVYISPEKYKDFANISPIWVIDNFGGTSATPHFYLIRFFEGLLSYAGATFQVNEKIFFFMPIIFGASIGSYLLGRLYFSPVFAFAGSIVFTFCTPLLFNYAGPLTIGVVFALTPLAVWLTYQYSERYKSKALLFFTSLLFSILILYELRITLLVILISIGYVLFRAVTSNHMKLYVKTRAVPFIKLFALIFLFNLFWVLPYAASSGSVTFSNLLDTGLFTSYSNMSNAITLFHPFWTNERPATFIIQDIPWYAWLIPFFAFIGILISRKELMRQKDILYWMIIAVSGMLLVKQVNEPFVDFYPWLFDTIPGFAAFRESSKFYLLIAISYSVLIPFSLSIIYAKIKKLPFSRQSLGKLKYGLFPVIYTAALSVFIINTIPLLTGSLNTLYKAREIPQDYQTFNNFAHEQNSYFRTLWFPTNSRWALNTSQNPVLSAANIDKGEWLKQVRDGAQANQTLRDKASNLLTSKSSNQILDRLSVKYVIVPLRDTMNDDDFFKNYGNSREYYINTLNSLDYLKKVDIASSSLAVYENADFDPYFNSLTSISNIRSPSDTQLDAVHDFSLSTLGKELQFQEPSQNNNSEIVPLFNQKNMKLRNNLLTTTAPENQETKYYMNVGSGDIFYSIIDSNLTFYKKGDQKLDGSVSPTEPLASTKIDRSSRYYLSVDETVYSIVPSEGSRFLGTVENGSISLHKALGEASWTESFESPKWNERIAENCNKEVSALSNSMKWNEEDRKSKGSHHIELSTLNGASCTRTKEIAVSSGSYLVSFDYKMRGADGASFDAIFNNNIGTIHKTITNKSVDWQTARTLINVPEGATTMTLRFYGNADYQQNTSAITSYDDVRLTKVDQISRIDDFEKNTFMPFTPPSPALTYRTEESVTGKNVITNGDFSSGLWQKKVADCNNFDNNPVIAMSKEESKDRGSFLQLEANRHTACTSKTDIPVDESKSYRLTFDYQSPNADIAGIYLRFNDSNNTSYEKRIGIKNNTWQTYDDTIKVPFGASKLSISVFSYGAEKKPSSNINRYDTFNLVETPNLKNKYYAVSTPPSDYIQPKSISFTSQNNTKKTVSIKGATTPFYLSMSESYNPLWEASLTGSNEVLSNTKLNDLQNSWYVNPTQLCKGTTRCVTESNGSYSFTLNVNFKPQQHFYLGAIISGVTLIGCILYVALPIRRKYHAPRP